MFQGETAITIDDKGRLSVPTAYREAIARACQNRLVLTYNPFEPGCLRFHENERAVRTASSEQVRQPIYREGVDQWRHYESWLDPLKQALGPALDVWSDTQQL